jgi:hypothetical protein
MSVKSIKRDIYWMCKNEDKKYVYDLIKKTFNDTWYIKNILYDMKSRIYYTDYTQLENQINIIRKNSNRKILQVKIDNKTSLLKKPLLGYSI